MNIIKTWIVDQPRWLWLLLTLYIAKGVLIASIGPAWYGEDEPSHFGYIEALGRLDVWYSFRDNFASIDMRLAHRLMDSTAEPEWALKLLETPRYRSYRAYAAHHKNATAYQAPLYYWLMSQLYQQLDSWSIVSVLYLFRYLNVFIGATYLLVVYGMSTILYKANVDRFVMTAIVSNMPLLSLLSATVTVQVTVFLLYGIFLYGLLRARLGQLRWYSVSIVAVAAGLLTQQAFMAAPVIMLFVLAYDYRVNKVSGRTIGRATVLLTLTIACVVPQLYQRHTETRYTLTRGQEAIRDITPITYIIEHGPRVRAELMEHFWDQNRSMVPYYASEKAVRALVVVTTIASIGFLHWFMTRQHHHTRWLVIAGVSTLCFVGAHLIFDYRVTKYSGQEYLKARYFYPLLPIIVWSWIVGLKHLFENSGWYRPLIATYISIIFIAQGTAIAWLILSIANR